MNDLPLEPETVTSTYESNPTSIQPTRSSMGSGEIISIITVLAITVVMLCCIGTCALMGFAFLMNPPW